MTDSHDGRHLSRTQLLHIFLACPREHVCFCTQSCETLIQNKKKACETIVCDQLVVSCLFTALRSLSVKSPHDKIPPSKAPESKAPRAFACRFSCTCNFCAGGFWLGCFWLGGFCRSTLYGIYLLYIFWIWLWSFYTKHSYSVTNFYNYNCELTLLSDCLFVIK